MELWIERRWMYSVFETVVSCAYGYCLIIAYLKEIDKDLSISTGFIAVTVFFNPLRGKIPKHPTSDDIITSFSLPSSLSSFLSSPMLFTQHIPHLILSHHLSLKLQIKSPTPLSASVSSHLTPSVKSFFTKKRTYRPPTDRPTPLSFFLSLSLFLPKIMKKKKKKKKRKADVSII